MIFIAKPFDELTTYKLYEIMKARAKVFVGEEKFLRKLKPKRCYAVYKKYFGDDFMSADMCHTSTGQQPILRKWDEENGF